MEYALEYGSITWSIGVWSEYRSITWSTGVLFGVREYYLEYRSMIQSVSNTTKNTEYKSL